MSQTGENTFHLGLTMAGAVSAGSYTGGVLDYIFEVLDKWERAKKGELEGINIDSVPKHNIVIDAMGGTSAGAMTTSMAVLYALKNKITPIKDEDADKVGGKRGNVFYDSWVNLVDDENKTTIEKALTDDDITESGELKSLLNSAFIDEIAKSAFTLEGDPGTNPAESIADYISKDLELIITHSMLRGIPLEVAFSSNSTLKAPPSHSSYEHFLMSHFRLNNGNPVNEDHYMWLNPYHKESSDRLIRATVATGAFPIGLVYRKFDSSHFNKEYLKTILSRQIIKNLGDRDPKIVDKIKWDTTLLKDYKSLSVDGGAINNEPYGEVLSTLKKYKTPILKDGKKHYNYGMIMIDPFPDFHKEDTKYEESKNLFGVIPRIIQMLWDQSKIKRNEMIDQFTDKGYRGVIFPKKYIVENDEIIDEYEQPIATGMMGGFSGFIDIKFRHHDFYLGRNNARNFVRAFLSLPYNDGTNGKDIDIHPIHQSWTEEQREKFKITLKGESYLPIIPDMNMLLKDVNSKEESLKYTISDPPQITKNDLYKLKKPLKNRIKAIINILLFPKNKNSKSWWKRFLLTVPKFLFKIILKLFRNLGIKHVTNSILNYLYHQLGKAKFIKDYKPKTPSQ